jgi:hypothetical protein
MQAVTSTKRFQPGTGTGWVMEGVNLIILVAKISRL